MMTQGAAKRIMKRCQHRLSNALVQLQARYNPCGEAAAEKCLSAATFVRPRGEGSLDGARVGGGRKTPTNRQPPRQAP